MNKYMLSAIMLIVGTCLGAGALTGAMVWNMETVPDGHAWMLYEFELPMPSSELPNNAKMLHHW